MAANPIIYCLENLGDYVEFERLCSDLMVRQGYSSIEPLGGFKDRGRDALDTSTSGKTTIFAYSVRDDWRSKLAEDAQKINKHGHKCDKLVFVTTANFTNGQRDEAVQSIFNEYGWELDIFGLERLRVMLDLYPELITKHPQIFTPSVLKIQENNVEWVHVFISAASQDSALANWLTKRLTAEGYAVWFEEIKLLGGETYPDDVDNAISHKAFRVIALYSPDSLQNQEVMRQRAAALAIGKDRGEDFLIPLNLGGIEEKDLDRITSTLQFINFQNNWATGLQHLLKKLESINCPKKLTEGRQVAAGLYLGKDVLLGQPEMLISNFLMIEKIPNAIRRFQSSRPISRDDIRKIRLVWPHRGTKPGTFLSFQTPPSSIINEFEILPAGGSSWSDLEKIDGINSRNIVSELLAKSLLSYYRQRGLQYCPTNHLFYFPDNLVSGNKIKYVQLDGRKSNLQVVGQRKFWRPNNKTQYYMYYFAPDFRVIQNFLDSFTILFKLRIRFTDTNGTPLMGRTNVSRRKHLCKGWWNEEWLNRMLAVCHYLAPEGKILIGEDDAEKIIINGNPLQIQAAEGVNEQSLDQLSFAKDQILPNGEGEEGSDQSLNDSLDDDGK